MLGFSFGFYFKALLCFLFPFALRRSFKLFGEGGLAPFRSCQFKLIMFEFDLVNFVLGMFWTITSKAFLLKAKLDISHLSDKPWLVAFSVPFSARHRASHGPLGRWRYDAVKKNRIK